MKLTDTKMYKLVYALLIVIGLHAGIYFILNEQYNIAATFIILVFWILLTEIMGALFKILQIMEQIYIKSR